MPKTEKMKCPGCRARMNHHADKLMYETSPAPADDIIGGVVVELHQCPACGESASRPEAYRITAENRPQAHAGEQ